MTKLVKEKTFELRKAILEYRARHFMKRGLSNEQVNERLFSLEGTLIVEDLVDIGYLTN